LVVADELEAAAALAVDDDALSDNHGTFNKHEYESILTFESRRVLL
jgi:hypothetical protein